MKKTLLILGAGASKDFCKIFPTGIELIKEINYHFLTEKKFPEVSKSDGIYLSALMNNIAAEFLCEDTLFRMIKNQLWKLQLDYEYYDLRNQNESPISIDSFIARNIKDGILDNQAVDIIKYCICYLIKGYEEAFTAGNFNRKDNWISKFAEKLSYYHCDKIIDNLTVITFNYDRIFEKFFIENLCLHQNIEPEKLLTLQNQVKHVYGSLGCLDHMPFGNQNMHSNIKKIYKEIKLIDERNQQGINLVNADQYSEVHFIGFGYDKANMALINLNQFSSASLKGTAFGLNDSQIRKLKSDYNIVASNVNCKEYVERWGL